MPKIFHATDVDHSTMAQTAELKHGKRKQLLVKPRLRQRLTSKYQ
ncbi:hypothetical protein [Loigolactobacillus rennini]|nr:hypothetical protein [Loigolactobacillus rennini]